MRSRHGTVDQLLDRANAEHRYEVRRSQLPLSCPMPSQYLWNAHPKVYLPIEKSGGEAKCPYCGAQYTLVDDD
ncbi:MAG: zinc-finger domain-containing protein [Pseudomonadota bacterium]